MLGTGGVFQHSSALGRLDVSENDRVMAASHHFEPRMRYQISVVEALTGPAENSRYWNDAAPVVGIYLHLPTGTM